MNAREYLDSKNWGDSHFLDSGLWPQICEWMEEYHQQKSQEEAEERYGKGLQFFTDLMMSKFGWSAITIQEIADEALRIASGKEEG